MASIKVTERIGARAEDVWDLFRDFGGVQRYSPQIEGCSVEGDAGWSLGVLGSTRMEYSHVVALVDHVARALADNLRGRST